MKWTKIWSNRPYPPFLMSLAAEATVDGFKKIFKASKITEGRNYWLNAASSYFYPEKELKETVENLSRKAIKSSDFVLKLFKIAYGKSVKLRRFSERYRGRDLSKLPDGELLKFIDIFSKKFFELYSYATVATLLGYQDEGPIYRKFNNIIEFKTRNCPERFSDYLLTLSSPPKKLKSNFLDLEILKVAAGVKEKKLKSKAQILKNYKEALRKIEKIYSPLSFNLCDKPGWDLDYFVKSVRDKLELDINKKIAGIKNYEKETAKSFNKLAKKLNLSSKELNVCELVRNLGYYKWAREHEFTEAFYNLKFIQDEVGRRVGLTTLETKYLLAGEHKLAMASPAKYKNLAKGRIKNSLEIVRPKGDARIIIGGKAKKEFLKMDIATAEQSLKVSELTGLPAYPGKVKGAVKIINSVNDMNKMEKNDILVSVATAPDVVPAMKKAAAIVTDEGGITCHATIVSRELKKPCVVGTKIATKVFKDGDLVEVDADKGTVRKINK